MHGIVNLKTMQCENKIKHTVTNCLAISKLHLRNNCNFCLYEEMLSISDYKQCRPLAALKPKATASPKHCGAHSGLFAFLHL